MHEPRIKTSGRRMEMADDIHQDTTPVMELGPESYLEVIQDAVVEPYFPSVVPDPRAWRLMDDAPKDATLIEVKSDPDDPDEKSVTAKWRITRRRVHAERRWEIYGYWSDPLTRFAIPFEPFVWRMPEGFLVPGMVI